MSPRISSIVPVFPVGAAFYDLTEEEQIIIVKEQARLKTNEHDLNIQAAMDRMDKFASLLGEVGPNLKMQYVLALDDLKSAIREKEVKGACA